MNIWESIAHVWPEGFARQWLTTPPKRRTGMRQPFDVAMQRWQESARLWDLAQQHGTRGDQIADAYAHYELDAANVRALYQPVGR